MRKKLLTDASKKSKLQTAICLNLAVSSDFIKWCQDSSTCLVLYETSTPDGLYNLLTESLGLSACICFCCFHYTFFVRWLFNIILLNVYKRVWRHFVKINKAFVSQIVWNFIFIENKNSMLGDNIYDVTDTFIFQLLKTRFWCCWVFFLFAIHVVRYNSRV